MFARKPLTVVFGAGFLSGILMTSGFFTLLYSEPKPYHDTSWNFGARNHISFVQPHHYKYENGTNESTVDYPAMRQYPYNKKGEEIARELFDKVRVLCWVATIPKNHKTKAAMIRDTWGKRCNILLFMSSIEDPSLPAVKLDVREGRSHLFEKTKEAMRYVYEYYKDQIDWVLKADDDTFVVVENLRYMLSKYDPSEASYLGCRFRPFTKQGFMSGGAGYVLSKKALTTLVQEGIGSNGKCLDIKNEVNGEDVLLGTCLEAINVTAKDTRDERGRGRFFPYRPEFHLFPDHSSPEYQWYWKYQYYPDAEDIFYLHNVKFFNNSVDRAPSYYPAGVNSVVNFLEIFYPHNLK